MQVTNTLKAVLDCKMRPSDTRLNEDVLSCLLGRGMLKGITNWKPCIKSYGEAVVAVQTFTQHFQIRNKFVLENNEISKYTRIELVLVDMLSSLDDALQSQLCIINQFSLNPKNVSPGPDYSADFCVAVVEMLVSCTRVWCYATYYIYLCVCRNLRAGNAFSLVLL